MTLPIRNLPLVQNWDCHSCGDCCRQLEAVITDEEKQRLEKLDLAERRRDAPGPGSCAKGWLAKSWALRRRPDGSCVFLTSANRCRLHETFGAEAKPFVCRLFPFMLIPAGNHWRVGLRFACPSAAGNKGRPLAEHDAALVQYVACCSKSTWAGQAKVPRRRRCSRASRFPGATWCVLCRPWWKSCRTAAIGSNVGCENAWPWPICAGRPVSTMSRAAA